MSRWMLWLLALALAPACLSGEAVEAVRVEVITAASRYPISGAEALSRAGIAVQVYDLEAPARLEAELSQGLPGAEDAASARALATIEQLDQTALAQRATTAYGAQIKALEYRLDRYPAVVFDGAAVVYGVTRLPEALAQYLRWRRTHPPTP